MRVESIKPNIGAIIEVERSALGDPGVAKRCHELLEQHGVLVFPRIGVTDQEQLAFTDSLGRRLDFSSKVAGGTAAAPNVYKVTLDPKVNSQQEYVRGTFFWHMDGLTMGPMQPPKATLLSARAVAPKGGHTYFANTYAAYDGLPDQDKADIADFRVLHDLTYLETIIESPTEDELKRWKQYPPNNFPLVWTHQSGRKSLILGSTADRVVGQDLAAGRSLLAGLLDWCAQPAFSYVHKWQEGDLVIWDNYAALHRVTPYGSNSGRSMHRTTIEGVETLN